MSLETRLKGMILVYWKAKKTRESESLQNRGEVCSYLEMVSDQITNSSKDQKCSLIMLEGFVTLSPGSCPYNAIILCVCRCLLAHVHYPVGAGAQGKWYNKINTLATVIAPSSKSSFVFAPWACVFYPHSWNCGSQVVYLWLGRKPSLLAVLSTGM